MPKAKRALPDVVRELTGKNIKTDFEDFDTRLFFQKALYLLQETGSISEKRYFNYYAFGPYSPEWAKDGFAVSKGKKRFLTVVKNLNEVQSLCDVKKHDVNWLVALATLHWYVNKMSLNRVEARRRAEADGKTALLATFDEAWDALHNSHLIS